MLYATIQLNKVKNQDEWDVMFLLYADLLVFIFDCIGVLVSGHRKNNKKFVSPLSRMPRKQVRWWSEHWRIVQQMV
jgi:hypothetical protein